MFEKKKYLKKNICDLVLHILIKDWKFIQPWIRNHLFVCTPKLNAMAKKPIYFSYPKFLLLRQYIFRMLCFRLAVNTHTFNFLEKTVWQIISYRLHFVFRDWNTFLSLFLLVELHWATTFFFLVKLLSYFKNGPSILRLCSLKNIYILFVVLCLVIGQSLRGFTLEWITSWGILCTEKARLINIIKHVSVKPVSKTTVMSCPITTPSLNARMYKLAMQVW